MKFLFFLWHFLEKKGKWNSFFKTKNLFLFSFLVNIWVLFFFLVVFCVSSLLFVTLKMNLRGVVYEVSFFCFSFPSPSFSLFYLASCSPYWWSFCTNLYPSNCPTSLDFHSDCCSMGCCSWSWCVVYLLNNTNGSLGIH